MSMLFVRSGRQLVKTNFRCLSSLVTIQTPPLKNMVTEPATIQATGETLLYKGAQERSVLMMFGSGLINLFYWSYSAANCIIYKDVVIDGIAMGGDLRWPAFGALGTGLVFFLTNTYSRHAVRHAYESKDGMRVGFQMYTMFGQPGHKIEVLKKNAYFNTTKGGAGLSNTVIPLRVEGVSKNVLINSDGIFYDNASFLDMLDKNTLRMLGSTDPATFKDFNSNASKGKYNQSRKGKNLDKKDKKSDDAE